MFSEYDNARSVKQFFKDVYKRDVIICKDSIVERDFGSKGMPEFNASAAYVQGKILVVLGRDSETSFVHELIHEGQNDIMYENTVKEVSELIDGNGLKKLISEKKAGYGGTYENRINFDDDIGYETYADIISRLSTKEWRGYGSRSELFADETTYNKAKEIAQDYVVYLINNPPQTKVDTIIKDISELGDDFADDYMFEKSVGQSYYNKTDYSIDLAISNIMDGKATIEDFKLFEPGNTENRQLFYETTGMKLPENSQLSYYRLINLNNRNRMFNLYSNHNALNVDNLTLPEYRKHLEKQNVDTKIKDLYLKHNNRLKNSDSLTANGEGGIIKKNNASLSQTEYTYVKKETGWSDDVVNYIRTLEEADVYINAGLKEVQVGDRKVLIRSDIDLDMVTPEGDTNRERMNKGKAPYTKSGEKIELHHIGQKNESPLAELAKTEHRGKGRHGKLHNLKMKSKVDHDNFNSDREMYWKERLKNMELEEKLYE